MAVLKIVSKLYQEKISEKLKEEISLVTTGEAKYYNLGLYKFFSIQIYSVLQILTMKREKCIWILLKKRIFQKNIKRNY